MLGFLLKLIFWVLLAGACSFSETLFLRLSLCLLVHHAIVLPSSFYSYARKNPHIHILISLIIGSLFYLFTPLFILNFYRTSLILVAPLFHFVKGAQVASLSYIFSRWMASNAHGDIDMIPPPVAKALILFPSLILSLFVGICLYDLISSSLSLSLFLHPPSLFLSLSLALIVCALYIFTLGIEEGIISDAAILSTHLIICFYEAASEKSFFNIFLAPFISTSPSLPSSSSSSTSSTPSFVDALFKATASLPSTATLIEVFSTTMSELMTPSLWFSSPAIQTFDVVLTVSFSLVLLWSVVYFQEGDSDDEEEEEREREMDNSSSLSLSPSALVQLLFSLFLSHIFISFLHTDRTPPEEASSIGGFFISLSLDTTLLKSLEATICIISYVFMVLQTHYSSHDKYD